MDSTSKYFIEVIVCAINGGNPKLPDDIIWQNFIALAYKHGYICLAADMSENYTGIDENLKKQLLEDARVLKSKEKFRNIYLNDLFNKLEEKGLYSMPIKGFEIKNLYPKPYMREMNDIDVLIKAEQLPEVRRTLESNGYVYDHTSTHEVVFNLDPFINLEIHTQLISKYHGEIYEIFDDVWDKSEAAQDCTYKHRMTIEYLYIHALVHFAFHYQTAGGGIKPIVDLWLIHKALENKPNADLDFVKNKIEQLEFQKFSSVILHLGRVWFEGAEHTPETRQTEKLIIYNGAYGSIENYTMLRFYRLAEDVNNPILKRVKVLSSVMFMKPATLEIKYPALKKHPYLYPFYTVLRWWQILTKRGSDVKKMARVTFNSEDELYSGIMNEVIENHKALGFKKYHFDKKYYD